MGGGVRNLLKMDIVRIVCAVVIDQLINVY